jgi:Ca-activated chloride channel homolog
MNGIYFANPELLHLGWLLIPVIVWYFYRFKKRPAPLRLSSSLFVQHYKPGLKNKLIHLPFLIRLMAASLLIIGIARPQSKTSWQDVKTEGIDIMIAMDISASMLAQDFKPNRLEASKEVAINFINDRPNDRIGLVIFSGESFTMCPLTTDHSVLVNLFKTVKTGMVQDGTAIGMGLANAVSRLKDSKGKSKVVILLTDGVNNAGSVSPQLAADLARPFNIRIYGIGVGTKGMAYSPVGIYPNGQYAFDYVKVEIDESMMKQIAEFTGGKYFRATNNKALKEIYKEIDQLEKTISEEKHYSKKTELFRPLAAMGLLLLLLEFLLRNTLLKSINPL